MTGESAISADLSFHHLSASSVRALARGEGGREVVAELLAAERSRRLLMLRALDDGLPKNGRPLGFETAVSHEAAWALLERVQRQSPEVFDDVLMSPHTGMWLSLALRQLRGRTYDEAPLWVVTGHLSALAAAAGARAGLDFSMTVPVRSGVVPLPTLGCAVIEVTEPWSTAQVVGRHGRLSVRGARGEVAVPTEWQVSGPGWHAVRRVAIGPAGRAKRLVLEELDPYRTFPRPSAPALMTDAERASWQHTLAAAWEVLLRADAESADAMRQGLMSVAPVSARERFRPYSGTAGDAFGSVTASHPDDAAQLAATLVHEFQHTKLGGLMHLGPLSRAAPDPEQSEQPGQPEQSEQPGELFYAPWRDDPRPLGGLLQGIYAFAGVARFWRVHRHAADAAYAPLAHFEFALWRTQVWSTLNLVAGHGQLTPLGRRVIEALRERCAEWMADSVPALELQLARDVAFDHRARWRTHHLRPPVAAVEEALRAWQRGDDRPPAALSAEPGLVPDPEGRHLDAAAILARYRITEPDGAWRQTAAMVGSVQGVGAADVLLARGDHARARDAYAAQLSGDGEPVAAWVGLGRALAGGEDDRGEGGAAGRTAAWLLCRYPERARAVQDALRDGTGRGADPVRLAEWLARGATTERWRRPAGAEPFGE
ncbi:HEXXH motif domain-containing protein [Streptomyces sp. NPDC056486]|uniref:HEXXH motif domain-containing protein n=1 Tax=Streptomyces sp. NPDC056486 TaxID=3345835 RepID=UPI00367C9AF3